MEVIKERSGDLPCGCGHSNDIQYHKEPQTSYLGRLLTNCQECSLDNITCHTQHIVRTWDRNRQMGDLLFTALFNVIEFEWDVVSAATSEKASIIAFVPRACIAHIICSFMSIRTRSLHAYISWFGFLCGNHELKKIFIPPNLLCHLRLFHHSAGGHESGRGG
jgi:hypothetical protein